MEISIPGKTIFILRRGPGLSSRMYPTATMIQWVDNLSNIVNKFWLLSYLLFLITNIVLFHHENYD